MDANSAIVSHTDDTGFAHCSASDSCRPNHLSLLLLSPRQMCLSHILGSVTSTAECMLCWFPCPFSLSAWCQEQRLAYVWISQGLVAPGRFFWSGLQLAGEYVVRKGCWRSVKISATLMLKIISVAPKWFKQEHFYLCFLNSPVISYRIWISPNKQDKYRLFLLPENSAFYLILGMQAGLGRIASCLFQSCYNIIFFIIFIFYWGPYSKAVWDSIQFLFFKLFGSHSRLHP